jgi:MscS family membrane protein
MSGRIARDLKKQRRLAVVLALALFLIVSPSMLGLMLVSGADPSNATVIERQGQTYDTSIRPGKTATFKWDLVNPTNATMEFSVKVLSDNPEVNGTVDRDKVQVYSGQTDTITLKVRSDVTETTKAKFTLVFTIRNLSTNVTLTAYKSASVKVVVTNGVNFHGLFTLQPTWLGLQDNDYTKLLLIVLLYLIIATVAIAVVLPLAGLAVSKTETKIDDIVFNTIRKPLFLVIMFYGMLDAIDILDFIPNSMTKTFNILFGLGLLLVILHTAYKLLIGVLRELRSEYQTKSKAKSEFGEVIFPLLEKVGTVLIAVVGIIGILYYFGVDITVAAASVGVGGIVLAFALQSTISNFFGGIFILLDRPFKVGDIIMVDTDFCKVQHIGLRSTQVYHVFQHSMIIIPNDQLANSKIHNLSAPDQEIRVKVYWEGPYGVDMDMFQKLMSDIVKGSPKELGIIKGDPKKLIWTMINEMKSSTIMFVVGFWVDDVMKQWDAASYVRTTIYKECNKRGIEIPFPKMDVYIKQEPKGAKV